jgi:hypothetical protein
VTGGDRGKKRDQSSVGRCIRLLVSACRYNRWDSREMNPQFLLIFYQDIKEQRTLNMSIVRNECLTDADERRRSPNIGQSHSDIGARRRVSRTSATTPGLIPVSRATSSTQRLRSHRLLFCIALISSQLGSLGGCRLSYSHSAHHRRSGSSPKATGTTLELSL